MGQGCAHKLLDIGTFMAACDQLLNPNRSSEFLDPMALPVRDQWTSIAVKVDRCGFDRLAEGARGILALPATQAPNCGSRSVFVGSSEPMGRN
jgi:hypothetical protein